jgi:hypothetical protein
VITGAQPTDTGRAHLEIGYSKATSSTEVVKAIVDLAAAWDPVASRSSAAVTQRRSRPN